MQTISLRSPNTLRVPSAHSALMMAISRAHRVYGGLAASGRAAASSCPQA